MIGAVLRLPLLPLRCLVWAYCQLRNLRRPKPFLAHRVPDRFSMHRPAGFAAMFLPQREAQYFDYLLFLRTLERQNQAQRIVLQVPEMRCSWAEVEEIAARIDALRRSGKTVLAHAEGGNLKTLFLMAAAETRLAAPHAEFTSDRPAAEPYFVRKLLDRIGIRMEVLTAGRFKSAGETFTRTQLSRPAREALATLLDDLRGMIDARLELTPGLDRPAVKRLLRLLKASVFVSAEDLQETGFITGLVTDARLQEEVVTRSQAGATEAETEFDPRRHYSDESKVLRHYRRGRYRVLRKGRPLALACVALRGNLVPGRRGDSIRPEVINTAAYQDLFEGLLEGPEEAVFVHIDSPGGTSAGSELLHQSLRALAERKLVIAVLGSVAASGGYYIASAAERIFAADASITGSIGVFAMHANASTLYRRAGITRQRIKFDATRDVLSESQALTPAGRRLMKRHVERTYQLFLRRVSEGRGKQPRSVAEMAEGRVWSADRFRAAGLVDERMDLLAAMEWYRRERGYHEDREIRINFYPQIRTDLRSMLARGPFGLSLPAAMNEAGIGDLADFYRRLLESGGWQTLSHWPPGLFLRGL